MNVYRYVLFLTTDACMDAGGTIPWMESVESSRERRPRATQEAKAEGTENIEELGIKTVLPL